MGEAEAVGGPEEEASLAASSEKKITINSGQMETNSCGGLFTVHDVFETT